MALFKGTLYVGGFKGKTEAKPPEKKTSHPFPTAFDWFAAEWLSMSSAWESHSVANQPTERCVGGSCFLGDPQMAASSQNRQKGGNIPMQRNAPIYLAPAIACPRKGQTSCLKEGKLNPFERGKWVWFLWVPLVWWFLKENQKKTTSLGSSKMTHPNGCEF